MHVKHSMLCAVERGALRLEAVRKFLDLLCMLFQAQARAKIAGVALIRINMTLATEQMCCTGKLSAPYNAQGGRVDEGRAR